MDLKKQWESDLSTFKALQADLQKCMQTQQQLVSQQNENTMVLEELNRLDDEAEVYKLIGPALIKQDIVEARSNVSKRLDFIKGEMKKLEGQMSDLQNRAERKRGELQDLQRKIQTTAGAAAGQVAA